MEELHVKLTNAQARNLINGANAVIKPLVGVATHAISLHPEFMRKLSLAHRKGKGARVSLAGGGSLRDILNSVKNGFNKAGQFYHDKIVPAYGNDIRAGLSTAINYGLPALAVATGNPELAPAIGALSKQYSRRLVNTIGDETHAFGFREEFQKAKKHAKQGKQVYDKYLKEYVAPHLKRAATVGKDALVSHLKHAAPRFEHEIADLDRKYGERAVKSLGRVTGAYGLLPRGLSDNHSNFLAPNHPAFANRFYTMPAIGGGSFLSA